MCQLLGLSSSDPVRLTFDWDSDEPGLQVNLHRPKPGTVMTASSRGLTTARRCSRHALVTTTPLSEQVWRPLNPGEIVRFGEGRRLLRHRHRSTLPGYGRPR